MRLILAVLSLAISVNVFAYSVSDSSVVLSAIPLLTSATTSGAPNKKQAAQVLNDSADFFQSGEVSPFLGQKITDVQALHPELSPAEALDVIVAAAQKILK